MANFDELKQKAKDTMENIADRSVELYKIAEEKTREFAKITKLTTEMTFEKGNLRKLYRELGQLYYELNKLSPEPGYAQLCAEIASSLDSIAAKQNEIDALRGFADFEPIDDVEEDAETKDDVEIVVESSGQSDPLNTASPLRSVQDTDDLEEPEGETGIGKTPPFTL